MESWTWRGGGCGTGGGGEVIGTIGVELFGIGKLSVTAIVVHWDWNPPPIQIRTTNLNKHPLPPPPPPPDSLVHTACVCCNCYFNGESTLLSISFFVSFSNKAAEKERERKWELEGGVETLPLSVAGLYISFSLFLLSTQLCN